ncbi:2-aminoadipate aminotransferase (plasmid) [Novosphingobium pentaromativorans US6-1]|uniref:HTH gntR-type domain-containing protein n=2 Tax=Novosphingobium pentaromativorans TaxID=205844 RepID=G6EGB6_9SPHN|nr:2-aminoadipate aminotransferase [Novosphingobium pentaromativorans US6-1]EHJ59805.1 hypothetical protein NSU_3387 [Novosphingobium pentaromativorans US6-1]
MWAPLIGIEDDSARTLQFQIRSRIVDSILDGTLLPGTPLPSSRKLATELKVSRNTVILSYQQLVDDGFLVARERSGFVVSAQGQERRVAPNVDVREKAATVAAMDWDARLRSQSSRYRSIEKPTNWQSYKYPFLYGQFDSSVFPINAWRQCCRQALGVLELSDWGRDTIDEDDPLLIEQIRTRILPRRGIWADKSEIMVTLGAQHALFLLSEALFCDTTVLGLEDPGYPDMRNIARIKGARVQPLPVDEHGLMLQPNLAGCDYVHVTPSHQCPTTVTMPQARRHQLLDYARESGTVLIEDDYDSETSFDLAPQPALKSFDESGQVIYVSSLSKILAPGLRLGFVVADARLIRELRALRRLMVRHPPLNNQRAIALFLSLGHYEPLIRRLTGLYRQRAQILGDALNHYVPSAKFRYATGGSCIWLQAPEAFDAAAAVRQWRSEGLLYEPGDVFFADRSTGRSHIRLGYSVIPEARIEPGVRLLAQAIAS